MSRAPKRVWWCPKSLFTYADKRLCPSYCLRNVCMSPGSIKCTAKPYVPEKGGERCFLNAKSVE
jgi:hypothetical protein